MIAAVDTFFEASNPVEDPLRKDLMDLVLQRHSHHPRSQQVELGPSEIGSPCTRKLAYGLMAAQECNPDWDPLPSALGVAGHKWMEGAAILDNALKGRQRWLIETKVDVTEGLFGHSDLYDTDTDTVIDHKFPGDTRFKKYVNAMPEIYKRQVQLYGRGFQRLGYRPKRVAIALYPRGGFLRKMHLYTAPYSDAIVDETLAKRNHTIALLNDFDVEQFPERYQWFAANPDSDCVFCPWWSMNPTGPFQCDGGMGKKEARKS